METTLGEDAYTAIQRVALNSSPQGDGNLSPLPLSTLRSLSHLTLPRKGMETPVSQFVIFSENNVALNSSPQGDGNYCEIIEHVLLIRVSHLTLPRKGMETRWS